MSALSPKADIRQRIEHVCFVQRVFLGADGRAQIGTLGLFAGEIDVLSDFLDLMFQRMLRCPLGAGVLPYPSGGDIARKALGRQWRS